MSLGQETTAPTASLPPAVPVLSQDGGAPPAEFMSGVGISGRPYGPRIWADTEFLMWWTKRVPVTTPLWSEALNPTAPPGALGSTNTAILLGGQSYDQSTRFGGRFTFGGWLDSESSIGLEGNYLFIAPQSVSRTVKTDGSTNTFVGAPFFNVTTGLEDFQAIGGLGVPSSAFLRLSNQLQGGEVNALARLVRTENLSLNGLAGFRYVQFKESLEFGEGSTNFFPGAVYAAQDSFRAANNFYGGNLGLRGEYRVGSFFVEATGKVALGVMNQTMDVNGVSSQFTPGIPVNTYMNVPSGFYALPTNSGHHTQNAFCVVPEAELKFGYNITQNIQAFVGYNFLYLSDVARPGTTIDHSINPTQGTSFTGTFPNTLVGPAAPGFSFSRSDFWAQGINFGLQFKF
jgi:hypothetical protein